MPKTSRAEKRKSENKEEKKPGCGRIVNRMWLVLKGGKKKG